MQNAKFSQGWGQSHKCSLYSTSGLKRLTRNYFKRKHTAKLKLFGQRQTKLIVI